VVSPRRGAAAHRALRAMQGICEIVIIIGQSSNIGGGPRRINAPEWRVDQVTFVPDREGRVWSCERDKIPSRFAQRPATLAI